MAEQDWLAPYTPASDGPAPRLPVSVQARFDLRPLTAGEVLDRMFSLYRAHFWLFAGLSAVAAAVLVVCSILRQVYFHFAHIAAGSPSYAAIGGVATFLSMLVYLVAHALSNAATTYAVNALYLGGTISLSDALRAGLKVWLRCLGVVIWQVWSAVWVILGLLVPIGILSSLNIRGLNWLIGVLAFGIFGAVIYGAIAYVRNGLAIPAALLESIGVRAAIRRSKVLVAGHKGRIFLLLLLFYVIWLVAGVIQMPLAYLLVRSRAAERLMLQTILLVVEFVAASVAGPVSAIGLCLFYFDERVRREGFDLEVLLRQAAPIQVAPVPAAPAAEIPELE